MKSAERTNSDYNFAKKIKRAIAKRYFGRTQKYSNIEGLREFNFTRSAKSKPHGTSVMLRVKNEARLIETSLRSIYRAFDEIVVIDNGSEDNTLGIVKQLKAEIDSQDKIKTYSYPHKVARCGAEHQQTPENSVHSLAYYYNWCLSLLSFDYAVKWDADMYLTPATEKAFIQYNHHALENEMLLSIPSRTIYIDNQGNAFESEKELFSEIRIFPNRNYLRYTKGQDWEVLTHDIHLPRTLHPDVEIYEIKETSQDEFSHWTETNFLTPRKKLEWENFHRVKQGDTSTDFKKINNPVVYRRYS